jgi:hypothetical protein
MRWSNTVDFSPIFHSQNNASAEPTAVASKYARKHKNETKRIRQVYARNASSVRWNVDEPITSDTNRRVRERLLQEVRFHEHFFFIFFIFRFVFMVSFFAFSLCIQVPTLDPVAARKVMREMLRSERRKSFRSAAQNTDLRLSSKMRARRHILARNLLQHASIDAFSNSEELKKAKEVMPLWCTCVLDLNPYFPLSFFSPSFVTRNTCLIYRSKRMIPRRTRSRFLHFTLAKPVPSLQSCSC